MSIGKRHLTSSVMAEKAFSPDFGLLLPPQGPNNDIQGCNISGKVT